VEFVVCDVGDEAAAAATAADDGDVDDVHVQIIHTTAI
jgi:hypothetical protein